MNPISLIRGKLYHIDGCIDVRFDRPLTGGIYSFISEEDSTFISLPKREVRTRVKIRK